MAATAYLMAPDGVSLPETLAMAQIVHTRLRVVLETLLGMNQPSAYIMDVFYKALMEQET